MLPWYLTDEPFKHQCRAHLPVQNASRESDFAIWNFRDSDVGAHSPLPPPPHGYQGQEQKKVRYHRPSVGLLPRVWVRRAAC